ncbi:LysR family transcriptional regulator [Nakamurella leprariae]|uniref:LysR family transcriptional regulator n=1 Tax=Nakamurella leprariae TaxID=2803911 RepID=A0A938YD89_9ACTN|nr:LysR family transcriptional regulator [Nakamurella leprariae]MBM9465725.1 LysR family transcriptional regulator [Nakamurella leprariae]
MLDLRRLEILRELDRCGTVAATAAAVHLTPSAVSQQLAALSREAGTPMLEPDGRRVRLTEAARLLLGHAHAIFTQLEHAQSDLAAFRDGDGGTVRLGSFPSAIPALAVPVLRRVAATSRLRVEVREVQPEEAADALLGRRVDVALMLTAGDLDPTDGDTRLASEHLLDDVMDVVLPLGHPLADDDTVDLSSLTDEDWILNIPGVPCWQITLAACEAAGFRPQVRHMADEFSGSIALVAAGAGVALLPRLARSVAAQAPVVVRPVRGTRPVRRIGSLVRAGTQLQPHIAPVLAALRAVGITAGDEAALTAVGS